MPGYAPKIREAAEQRYGRGACPEAIILTHGHFDHIGSLRQLLTDWDVPVYAHPLEMPFLTGRSLYPPYDPTVGGFFPFLSRFFPSDSYDSSDDLHNLPADGTVPGMPNWQWLHTPGHAPGHISLWRESDRTLIAGDAFVTVDMSKVTDTITQKQELTPPPTYATCDWDAAAASVRLLAGRKPFLVATGHGVPMSGADIAAQLTVFADHFPVPAHGRYVSEPAKTDEDGILSLPPPAPDPLPARLGALAALAAVAWGVALWRKRRKH